MQRSFGRTERLADAIQQELAVLIRDEMRDPRVKLVTLTGVEVSRDLGYAKVYVTQVNKERSDCKQAVEALNNAAGFLRSQLARVMDLRTTPKLTFYFDNSGLYGQKLSALIDHAVHNDEQRREKSSGTSHSDEE